MWSVPLHIYKVSFSVHKLVCHTKGMFETVLICVLLDKRQHRICEAFLVNTWQQACVCVCVCVAYIIH